MRQNEYTQASLLCGIGPDSYGSLNLVVLSEMSNWASRMRQSVVDLFWKRAGNETK